MKYDMIITDYDNTLGRDGEISEQNLVAVKEYIKRGGKFVICTGRVYNSITKICNKYDLNGLLVSYQGALICDLESGKVIREGGLAKDFALEMVKSLKEDCIDFVVSIDNKLYCEKFNHFTEYSKNDVEIVKVNDLQEFINDGKFKVIFNIICVGYPEKVKEYTAKYIAQYGDRAIFNGGADVLLEIINPNFTKGSAVKFLSEFYNIPLDKIMTVGDSTNDIELIRGEWHGVAVGDGKEQLKVVAKEITVPFNQNPIKTLIEKYCL